jgi:hypothetical protein
MGAAGPHVGETWVGLGIEIDFGPWPKKTKMNYPFKFSNPFYKI